MKNIKAVAPVTEPQKLSAKGVIKYIIGYSSTVFTAISLFLLTVQSLTVGEDEIAFVDPSRFLMLFPFALCTAAASLIFKARSLKLWAKFLIHYIVSATALYAFVCKPAENGTNPFSIVILASLLYFIAAGTILVIRAVKEKKERDAIPYQSVYGKITKK